MATNVAAVVSATSVAFRPGASRSGIPDPMAGCGVSESAAAKAAADFTINPSGTRNVPFWDDSSSKPGHRITVSIMRILSGNRLARPGTEREAGRNNSRQAAAPDRRLCATENCAGGACRRTQIILFCTSPASPCDLLHPAPAHSDGRAAPLRQRLQRSKRRASSAACERPQVAEPASQALPGDTQVR